MDQPNNSKSKEIPSSPPENLPSDLEGAPILEVKREKTVPKVPPPAPALELPPEQPPAVLPSSSSEPPLKKLIDDEITEDDSTSSPVKKQDAKEEVKEAKKWEENLEKVGIFYDKLMLLHEEHRHPESPDRLRGIKRLLEENQLWSKCKEIKGREVTKEEVLLCHTEKMYDAVKQTKFAPKGDTVHFGSDTFANRYSFQAANVAVGGLLELIKSISKGSIDRGFAFIRPPGHHAEIEESMGFCLFNNVAIAARYAQTKLGLRRILILDWDVHHGNGTQHIFENDDSVLFMSVHKGGTFYPGTGKVQEVGLGKGVGFTVNCPFLMSGMDDADYLNLFKFVFTPIASSFKPDLIIVSAGFDCAAGDVLGPMRVSPAGFENMLSSLLPICSKIVLALEGGYAVDVTARAVQACLQVLLGKPATDLGTLVPSAAGYTDILKCIKAHREYWPCLAALDTNEEWLKLAQIMEPKIKAYKPPSETSDGCSQQ